MTVISCAKARQSSLFSPSFTRYSPLLEETGWEGQKQPVLKYSFARDTMIRCSRWVVWAPEMCRDTILKEDKGDPVGRI